MDKAPSFTGVITSASRLRNSVNGNPRWRVVFTSADGGTHTYQTQSDASCNYEVENYLRSGEPVSVWLTKAGRVQYLREA